MRLPFIFISIHTLLVCSISFEGIAAHGHGVNHSNHTVHKGGCCKGHGVHDPDENFTTDTTAETFQGFLQQARDLLGKSVDSKLPKVMPSITTKKTSPSVSHEMPLLKIVGESKYFLVHEGHVGITYERIQEAVKAIKVAVADTYGLEDGDQAAATLLEFRNAIRNFSLVENRFKMVPRPWQCAASYESSKLSLQPCRECATYVNLKSLRYPLEKPSLIHQFKLLKENCLLSVGFQATFNPDYPYVLFSLSKPDGNIVVLRDDTIIKRLSLDGGPFTVSKMMKLRKTIDSQDQIYFSPKLDVFFNVHDSTPHYIDDLIFTLDTEFKKIYLQFYGVSSDRYEYSVSEQKGNLLMLFSFSYLFYSYFVAYFAFMKKIMSTLDNVTIVINNLTFNEELSCPQVPLYNESHISTSQKNLESKMAEDKSILVYYKKSVTTESMLSPGKTYQDKSIGWKGGNYQKLSYGKSFTSKKILEFLFLFNLSISM